MRASSSRRWAALLLVIGAGTAVAGCAQAPPPYREGDCVQLTATSPIRPVACTDPQADHQVVRVVTGQREEKCLGLAGYVTRYAYRPSPDYRDYTLCLRERVPGRS